MDKTKFKSIMEEMQEQLNVHNSKVKAAILVVDDILWDEPHTMNMNFLKIERLVDDFRYQFGKFERYFHATYPSDARYAYYAREARDVYILACAQAREIEKEYLRILDRRHVAHQTKLEKIREKSPNWLCKLLNRVFRSR